MNFEHFQFYNNFNVINWFIKTACFTKQSVELVLLIMPHYSLVNVQSISKYINAMF